MSKFLNVGVIWVLRSDEHFQFHWNMLSYLTAELSNLPALADAYADYKRLFDQEDIIFRHMQKMLGTEEVNELDRLRTSIFSSLNIAVKAAQKSMETPLNQAGKSLYPVFDAYKGLTKKSFNGKTAYITNLLQDLGVADKAAAINTLQLANTVTALTEANNNFISAYKQRAEVTYSQRAEGNMTDIMPPVNHAFNEVVLVIDSVYVANEVMRKDATLRATLDGLITEINALLLNTTRTVAYRNSGVNTGDPDMPPVPDPVEPYQFRASKQEFIVESGMLMLIEAPDPQSFHAALHDKAIGGIINTQTAEEPNRFEVVKFQYTDDQVAKALLLKPADDQDLLGSFSGEYITVELIKNGQVLAIIEGIRNPDGLA